MLWSCFYSHWCWGLTSVWGKVQQEQNILEAESNMVLSCNFQGTSSNSCLEEGHWYCSRRLEGSEHSLCCNITSDVKIYSYKSREKSFEPTGLIYSSKLNVLELPSIGADQLRQPMHMALNLPILPTTETACSLLWGKPAARPYPKTIWGITSRPGPTCQGLFKQCRQICWKAWDHLICCYRENHNVYWGKAPIRVNGKALRSMYDANRLL